MKGLPGVIRRLFTSPVDQGVKSLQTIFYYPFLKFKDIIAASTAKNAVFQVVSIRYFTEICI
jgi:hypothetical protein